MDRSTLTRSLAVSAVSALAVTGLSLAGSPALAADGPGVVLISQFNDGHDASLRYDGRDFSIRLTAESADPTAAVTFEYNADPDATGATDGWTSVTASSRGQSDQYVHADWTPGDDDLVGSTVAVRAVATSAAGTTPSAPRNGVSIGGRDSAVASVHLTENGNGTRGYLVQQYADSARTATVTAVQGTTSATDGSVELSWWRSADGTFQGRTDAQVEAASLKIMGSGGPGDPGDFVDGGRYAAVVDITGFDAGAGSIALGVERDSDHVQEARAYEQHVGRVSASPPPATRVGRDAEFRVTVVDAEQGGVVSGAEVRRLSDEEVVGYTDASGSVLATQRAGSAETYYVNTTDVDGYEDGVDPTTGEVVVPVYEPVATTVRSVLDDGAVFDDDEYADGDISVEVGDQQGEPVAGEEVEYKLYPHDTEAPTAFSTATTGDDGRAPVAFDPSGPDGAYTLEFRRAEAPAEDGTSSTSFTAGDATLTLTTDPGGAEPGGQIDYVGSLLVDGVPLAGRHIDLDYTRGVELVPGATADAGIVTDDGPVLTHSVTTDGTGGFAVTVDDRQETPAAPETGGLLVAATGDTVASESSTLDGDADESARARTRFGSGRGAVRSGSARSGPAVRWTSCGSRRRPRPRARRSGSSGSSTGSATSSGSACSTATATW